MCETTTQSTQAATIPQYDIRRVPVEEERRKLETESVYTTKIAAKATSKLLSFVSKSLPKLEGLEHVKRVKKEEGQSTQPLVSVVLCQTSKIERSKLEELLSSCSDLSNSALIVSVHGVPIHAPYTQDQFFEWRKTWPVAFKRHGEQKAQNEFSEADKEYVSRMIESAKALSRESVASGNRDSAVLISSPRMQQCIAQSMDQTVELSHPLKHPALCCIALVADAERERRRRLAQDSCSASITDNCIAPVVPSKRTTDESSSETLADANSDTAGYLCDGLDVFSATEPCVMCCMALVHSRIGRLFYCNESLLSGGISRYSLHSRKGLNHHFLTYQCVPVSSSSH